MLLLDKKTKISVHDFLLAVLSHSIRGEKERRRMKREGR